MEQRFKNVKSLGELKPDLGARVYVASDAQIIGKVILGDDSSIWFNTVARGDVNSICVGARSNIQDLCMLHVSKDFPLFIGEEVTVGHHAVLHGCHVGDNCLIGIGAIVNDGVKIGKGSVVAAGSLLPPGKVYPEDSLIMGSPAKVLRPLTEDEKAKYHSHFKSYVDNKNLYLQHEVY